MINLCMIVCAHPHFPASRGIEQDFELFGDFANSRCQRRFTLLDPAARKVPRIGIGDWLSLACVSQLHENRAVGASKYHCRCVARGHPNCSLSCSCEARQSPAERAIARSHIDLGMRNEQARYALAGLGKAAWKPGDRAASAAAVRRPCRARQIPCARRGSTPLPAARRHRPRSGG